MNFKKLKDWDCPLLHDCGSEKISLSFYSHLAIFA